uniref:Uncharacterized protein n=1 Tax=Oncorhynchus mykiss TaxID=8022 RepID=A0A8K9X9W4_ONCMY
HIPGSLGVRTPRTTGLLKTTGHIPGSLGVRTPRTTGHIPGSLGVRTPRTTGHIPGSLGVRTPQDHWSYPWFPLGEDSSGPLVISLVPWG